MVISGKDKGKSGSILSVYPKENRAIVKGINIVKKHQKPSKQGGGGIVEKELSVHISNLSFISIKDGKRTKIGYKFENNKKIRYEKKTGEMIKNV
ncbi:MAG: 50S ribosomal protein L24 [Alphaproteobacteria bacterium MarineAlpha6_Bin6]|nr:MAG: 50S ribosomal protein L24 [Alphaproteobacteria bacterium MarineAlpha6_Bin6]PPR32674.1 MAG: 50S ribosomal protein L24 [Alphaproteobacteria bacterium MarineAlpha6_Bin5]